MGRLFVHRFIKPTFHGTPLSSGLGGFEADPLASVDPEPGCMPHMPLSLGEEVMSMAFATERSKVAFAFGAMKRGGALGQQTLAGTGSQAADAGEARGGAAGGGDAAAGAASGGAGVTQVPGGNSGQDAASPLRHLSVRRLWSIMPLSVALQVRGTVRRSPVRAAPP